MITQPMGRKPTLRNAIVAYLEQTPMTIPELSVALGKSVGAVGSSIVRMEDLGMVRRLKGRPNNPRAYVFEMRSAER